MNEQKGANIQTNRQVDEQKRDKQTNGQTGGRTKKGQTDKRTDPLTRGLLYRFYLVPNFSRIPSICLEFKSDTGSSLDGALDAIAPVLFEDLGANNHTYRKNCYLARRKFEKR